MRGALIAVVWASTGLWAQSVIDPARIPPHLLNIGPQPEDRPLHCDIAPVKPALDMSFRFQAGYDIRVPMQQYFGPGHGWAILTRVTPENGRPVWLAARVRLPDVPLTTVVTDTFGGFLVGAGKYKVDWALYDDEGRVCRRQWKIEAKLGFGERHVEAGIPPHTVSDFAGSGLPRRPPLPPDAPPFRLTILLHAAPLSPRRMHFRASDRVMLLSTLSALVERAPATSIRLAVFNLDKQRVIYSNGDFRLPAMGQVNEALNRLELETVDVQTLGNPQGHLDLLESLIGREAGSPNPPDAVVFLGPAARYEEARLALDRPPDGTRFFYFQCWPWFPLAQPRRAAPDLIAKAVASLKGRVFQIYTPGQFADAIRDLDAVRR
jgi:hypothetical protein